MTKRIIKPEFEYVSKNIPSGMGNDPRFQTPESLEMSSRIIPLTEQDARMQAEQKQSFIS